MGTGRFVTAVVLLALVMPISAAPAGASPAQPSPASPSSASSIPCPKSGPVEPGRPPRPSPPPDVPAYRAVGGQNLDTAGLVVPVGVADPPANTAISWLVADLDSGQVLGACGPHEYGTPASVQKLLLAATFMEKLDPTQVVTVIHQDVDIPRDSSMVGLVEGGQYSVETLWLGLLLQSGNDTANVLARLGGDEGGMAAGVEAMNRHAKWLGAFQTHAVTPSGYDGPGQFTSAYDLALIARECFANELFKRYELTQRTQIPPQPPNYNGFQIQNENQLIYQYPGALGGKTGFTSLARHTYVGVAERNGRRLVATLLGAEPRPVRAWAQGAALLDWGFSLPADASVGRLVHPQDVIATSPSLPPSGTPGSVAAAIAAASTSRWYPFAVAWLAAFVALIVLIVAGRIVRRSRRRARLRRHAA